MALGISELTSSFDGTNRNNGNPYATASVSPTAGSVTLLLLNVLGDLVADGTPSVSGARGTWTLEKSQDYDTVGSPTDSLWVFKGTGSVTAEAISIDPGTSMQQLIWKVVELTGQHASTPVPQSASNAADDSNAIAVTLAAFADAGNGTLLVGGWDRPPSTWSNEGGSWVDIGSQEDGDSPGSSLMAAWLDGNDTSPTATITGGAPEWGAIALELAVAVGGQVPYQPWLQRAPILAQ